jgi:hypothetical protein
MVNSQAYWRSINLQQAEIEKQHQGGSVWITSLADESRGQIGGVVCDTSLRLGNEKYGVAARGIVDRTHRLSTKEEIAQFHEEQRRRSDACAVMQSRIDRSGNGFLYIDPKLQALGQA